jgi:hypothetical protein
VLGAGLSSRYGPFVGHRRSGGRVYTHMEPYSTLDQISALGALGLGCSGRAGSRRFRRGLGACREQACIAGMGLVSTGTLEGEFTLHIQVLHPEPDLCALRSWEGLLQ